MDQPAASTLTPIAPGPTPGDPAAAPGSSFLRRLWRTYVTDVRTGVDRLTHLFATVGAYGIWYADADELVTQVHDALADPNGS